MYCQESSTKIFEKFTWKIENFSRLNDEKIYSEPFIICGYPWRINLRPKGKNGDDNLYIYLEAMQTSNMSEGWSRNVEFKILLYNQVDTNRTIVEEKCRVFEEIRNAIGYKFVKLSELQEPRNGYLVKDTCIVGAEVLVYNAKLEKPVKLEVPMSNLKTISPVDAELFSPTIEEVMNCNTVGKFEELCSDNCSLVERPRKRSRKFNDLAFAAFGRVLYFLKNGKVKDMNDKTCKELQVLWDELKKFKFDLTWLEPQVQYALVLKSFVEKAIQVEKLMDNIVLLVLEMARLKAKLAFVEVNVVIERDLLKTKGIKEIDLDSELVSGSREFGETEQEKSSVEKFEKFTWKVENFSRLKTGEVYSEPFVIGGYPWKICLLRDDVLDGGLAIYLEAVETANMSEGWSRHVKFKLVVFNQLNTSMTITNDFGDCEFNASESYFGFDDFNKLDKLRDPNKGFMVDDACIVGAEVYVRKSTNETRLNQAANFNASLTFGSQISHMEEEVQSQNQGFHFQYLKSFSPVSTLFCIEPTNLNDAEMFSPSNEELVDFSSVEQIEETDNLSLVEHLSKTSHNFADFAFAALGRVFYFLKNRKVRDMNEQGCKDLQVLWDELQKFKFEFTWIEPQVQYALGMKSYVEKALQLEKLKENIVALQLEMERLNAKLVGAEVSFDKEKDLLKAKGYEERDLDSELGCGSWRP
ncbi:unnamed protein product [Trifolium pratense]|uniref:Uncharacterized protein n=1 Tax=Trifolium pratense TaxID=57577 RepID=A0ACB0IIW5_TRIPR|nr:unnamed protein product [Trifolium pratense]